MIIVICGLQDHFLSRYLFHRDWTVSERNELLSDNKAERQFWFLTTNFFLSRFVFTWRGLDSLDLLA